jgi:hypothetical protein
MIRKIVFRGRQWCFKSIYTTCQLVLNSVFLVCSSSCIIIRPSTYLSLASLSYRPLLQSTGCTWPRPTARGGNRQRCSGRQSSGTSLPSRWRSHGCGSLGRGSSACSPPSTTPDTGPLRQSSPTSRCPRTPGSGRQASRGRNTATRTTWDTRTCRGRGCRTSGRTTRGPLRGRRGTCLTWPRGGRGRRGRRRP